MTKQKAFEEVRSLARLSEKQEKIVAEKRALNDLQDLVDHYTVDDYLMSWEVDDLEQQLASL